MGDGSNRGASRWQALACVLGVLAWAGPSPAGPGDDALGDECDYGITLALTGQWVRAESVFVSLLSHAPSDPRALANLGNVHLIRGDLPAALAFYDAAIGRDTSDAGLRLNRATAYMLMGDPERALPEAREGVRRAGGERAAASLLGLRPVGGAAADDKGAAQPQVTRDEVRSLLAAAAGRIPVDTLRAKTASPPATTTARKAPPSWRSAGTRGAADTEATTLLYWKR